MKKLICLLVLIITIIVGYAYFHKTTPADQILEQKQQELQTLIDKNLQDEQDEKIRKLEIQALQNPEIITNEMVKVGELTVFKSTVTYTDVIRKTSFWGSKQMNVDLKFRYGISYDLTKILIDSYIEKTVYIKLNKYDLQIQYIEEDNEASMIDGESTWLAKEFTVEDVDAVRDNAKIKVTEYIENYDDAYVASMESLENNLRGLILKLGYDDVQFINE